MDDLHWWPAVDLAAAIRGREVSAVEALDHLIARIERLDGPINAVVADDHERARTAAADADRALARGDVLGPLHGVPMTVKDSFQTEGCVTTSGAPRLATHVPTEDAWVVAKLKAAGAIPFAKTNLPIFAGDIQSFNDVYGTTNNPHDLSRTCGGSSGGSAAALSMGFTPIELGSDIAGSIRCPAHYCGVSGHKPSYGIVPGHGQIPGMPGTFTLADLAVAGPMSRSVRDLAPMLEILVGPNRWDSPGWRVELPPARATELSELRIAAWLDDEHCPVDASTARLLGETITAIEHAGGHVDTEARPEFTLAKVDGVFKKLLFAALSGEFSLERLDELAALDPSTPLEHAYAAAAMRHREWLAHNERRLQIREKWRRFFESYDVILMPVQPRGAFAHDHSQPQFGRSVMIGDDHRPYLDLFSWTGPAGAGMLPATVVPIGVGDDGLPIGIQIVGPYLHDHTTIQAAHLISRLRGGCPRPALAS